MTFVIYIYPKVKLTVYYLFFFSSAFYPQTGAIELCSMNVYVIYGIVLHTYPKLKLAVYYLFFFAFDPKT